MESLQTQEATGGGGVEASEDAGAARVYAGVGFRG